MQPEPLPPRLTSQQQALLAIVFQGLRLFNRWPPFHWVDRNLDKEQGLDSLEVASTLPRGITNLGSLPLSRDEEVSLTLAGLAYLPQANEDLGNVLRTLWLAVEKDGSFEPSASETTPKLTSDELQDQLRLSDDQVQRLYLLVRWEPWTEGSSWQEGKWEVNIGRNIRHFRDVHNSITEYLQRRPPYALAFSSSALPVVPSSEDQASGPAKPVRDRLVFVLMPFKPSMEPVYATIRQVCSQMRGISVLRADEIAQTGRITEQIYTHIKAADVLVADISGLNANVMYELGYAHALGKRVIVLNTATKAPFDIQDYRQVRYKTTELIALSAQIAQFLENALGTMS